MPLIIASRAALRIALFPDNIISPDYSFNDHNLLTKLLKILTFLVSRRYGMWISAINKSGIENITSIVEIIILGVCNFKTSILF